MLPIVLSCALVDSVNPCTFAVFTGLLVTTLHTIGRRRMVFSGLSFTLAIFIVYLLIGLNLARTLAIYPVAKYVVSVLAMSMAVIYCSQR